MKRASNVTRLATIERDGWTLQSGEERQALHPSTFHIPDRAARESLEEGDAAQLLFEIETREGGRVIDRGVDRMWVIVEERIGHLYRGKLHSDPGESDGLRLYRGAEVWFAAEHVIAFENPPEAQRSRR